MPKYILDTKKTKDLHFMLQNIMFSQCEDWGKFPSLNDDEAIRNHCSQCKYKLACEVSNEITFLIATKKM